MLSVYSCTLIKPCKGRSSMWNFHHVWWHQTSLSSNSGGASCILSRPLANDPRKRESREKKKLQRWIPAASNPLWKQPVNPVHFYERMLTFREPLKLCFLCMLWRPHVFYSVCVFICCLLFYYFYWFLFLLWFVAFFVFVWMLFFYSPPWEPCFVEWKDLNSLNK